MLESFNFLVSQRPARSIVEMCIQNWIKRMANERRLSTSTYTCYTRKGSQWNFNGLSFQVMSVRSLQHQLLSIAFAAFLRNRNGQLST